MQVYPLALARAPRDAELERLDRGRNALSRVVNGIDDQIKMAASHKFSQIHVNIGPNYIDCWQNTFHVTIDDSTSIVDQIESMYREAGYTVVREPKKMVISWA
jgi:hypothetical protein